MPISEIGRYFVVLERPCWHNNVDGHAVYTQGIGKKRHKNGTYFLATNQLLRVRLTKSEVVRVRKFIKSLRESKRAKP